MVPPQSVSLEVDVAEQGTRPRAGNRYDVDLREHHGTIVLGAIEGTLERDRAAALERLEAAAQRRVAACAILDEADDELAEAVRQARLLGLAWDTIAAPIGMSRQAIAKRFV